MAIKKNFTGIDADVSNFISKKETPSIDVETTKNERMSLYVPSDVMQQIKWIAAATSISRNKVVLDLLGQALKNPQYQKICAAMVEVNKNINT